MQNVLLAGATGYLGRHIAEELIRKEYDATMLVRNANKLSLSSNSYAIKVAEVTHDMVEEGISVRSKPEQYYSSSPEIFKNMMSFTGHNIDHSILDPVIVAYIRMLISYKENANHSMEMQTEILKSLDIPEEDIFIAKLDYNMVDLPVKSQAIICFVLDQVYGKIMNTKSRIDQLKELGWKKEYIFEASLISTIQKGMVKVVRSYEVELDF